MLRLPVKRCGVFPTSFFRGLVFCSLVAVVALPLYTFFFLTPSVKKFITQGNKQLATELAAHMESKLISQNQQVLGDDVLTADVLKKINGTTRDFNLYKVRILYPNGEIFYSIEQNEVGRVLQFDALSMVVETGNSFAELIERGQRSLEGEQMPGDIVETYVPIMRNGKAIGVFAIYYDITERREQLAALIRIFYYTIYPIAVILFIAVIVSCRRANSNIVKRIEAEEQLREKSEKLEEKNEELRELILVCQDRQSRLEKEQKARQQAQEQVQEEMLKRERMRRDLLRHTVNAQEEERARIARELHDETAQTLTAASLNFASLKNMLASNPEVAELVGRLQDLCKQMHSDLYRLVHDLRPAQLDDLGLVPALRFLVDEGQRNTGLHVTFTLNGKQQRLEPFVETIVFRIVQEGLTNITKYAETGEAWVDLTFDEAGVRVSVRDKGKGFDPDVILPGKSGWGLAGIEERAKSLNGEYRITSMPGKGTDLEVCIPLSALSCPLEQLQEAIDKDFAEETKEEGE